MGTTELVHSAAWRYHQEPIFLFCTIVSSLVWVLNSFWWLIICCTSRHYILNISDWKKENILYNLTVIFLKTEDIFSWKQPSSLPFYVLLSTVGTMTDLDYLPERNRCFGSYFSSVQFSCSVVSNSLRPHESQKYIPSIITLIKYMNTNWLPHDTCLIVLSNKTILTIHFCVIVITIFYI